MNKNLSKIASQKKIKYFLISFVDLFGVLRAKLVPAQAINEMAKNGAGFGGFATYLDMTPADSDMLAIPDPDSLIQLPWNPEVGWLASDLVMDGKTVEQCPRVILKRQIEKLDKHGMVMQSGVECEFFLLNDDGSEISDPRDSAAKPCYDQSMLMRRYDVIKEICDCMLKLGWKPYQNDHEDANGQFEMNWHYSDCLTTADRHVFFKFMVKSIAEKHGFRATFMAKPFLEQTGSGMHIHMSMYDENDKNLFSNGDKLGSELLKHTIAGMQSTLYDSFSIFIPNRNGFRRIKPDQFVPVNKSWGYNNRTVALRIPSGKDEARRIEHRVASADANAYLTLASILAGVHHGITNKLQPSHFIEYGSNSGIEAEADPEIPSSLENSLVRFENSKILKEYFGENYLKLYPSVKRGEEDLYNSTFIPKEEYDFYL